MDTDNFKKIIEPFFWIEHKNSVSVCLDVGVYKAKIFQTRESEGFEGNGYDWTSLAKIFLKEQLPKLVGIVKFDSEAGMFCTYSSNSDALKTFITAFKVVCENETLMQNLFSRVELD